MIKPEVAQQLCEPENLKSLLTFLSKPGSNRPLLRLGKNRKPYCKVWKV